MFEERVMIKIVNHEHNTIQYTCSCGSRGMCSIKPLDRDAAIVIVIKCPTCQATEKLTLLQYSSDESKEKILKNLREVDFSWLPAFNEEI